MNADRWTDKALKELEDRIEIEYFKAGAELNEKARRYFEGYDETVKGKKVHHAGMKERIAKETQAYKEGKYDDKQWQAYLYSQLGRGEHWNTLKRQMEYRMLTAQKIAQGYTNEILPKIYTENNNAVAKIAQKSAMEQGVTGINFELVDENTIKKLMLEEKEVIPYRWVDIDEAKVNAWNEKNFNGALMQGILQGDSITHLADRLEKVAEMNRVQSVRTARTAVTSAQSAGKQDRYNNLAEQGCEMTKIWVATHDGRTREEHRQADGQEVPYNEPFNVGGEELMHPADYAGSPWNVYNCRCTMKTGKIKFKSVLSKEKEERANIRIAEEEPEKEKTEAFTRLMNTMKDYKVEYKEVEKLSKSLMEEEIIRKLAGGDLTDGSCSSLALAYCGNKNGFDVTDFRGGTSQQAFSKRFVIKDILGIDGVKGEIVKVAKEASETAKLIKGLPYGKQYYLAVGQHASIVENTENGAKYLELQSSVRNGWKPFEHDGKTTAETLIRRFGARKTQPSHYGMKYKTEVVLIDSDTFTSEEVRGILGYINTIILLNILFTSVIHSLHL